MAIKIIRNSSGLFRMECEHCEAIFEYKLHDVDSHDYTVRCPSCYHWNEHRHRLKMNTDRRTTGEWIKTNAKLAEMTCSACGFQYYGEHDIECMSNYCPDCGAKMKKEVK